MFISKKRALLLTLCTAFASTAFASSDSMANDYVLDPVVVTAMRTSSDDLKTPADISIFTEKDIARSGASNAYDVLRNTLGVTSQSQGFNGSSMGSMTSKIMIRGVAKGTLIMVNGVPMNQDGKYHLDDIPAEAIEKIELIKGGGSVLYGSEATGGVVNILLKKDLPYNVVKLGFGNFGKKQATIGVSEGKFSMIYTGEQRGHAPEMSGHSQTKLSYYDFGGGHRDSLVWNYQFNDHLRFTQKLSHNKYTYLQYDDSEDETKVIKGKTKVTHGYYGHLAKENFYHTNDQDYNLNYNNKGLQVNLNYNAQMRQYDIDEYKPSPSFAFDKGYEKSWRKGHHTTIDIQKEIDLGKDKALIGADYHIEDLDLRSAASPRMKVKHPYSENLKRKVGSVYASYNKEINEKDNLIVSARQTWVQKSKGVQTDSVTNVSTVTENDSQSKFTPELTYMHKVNGHSSVYGKVGRSFRLPNLTQIYGTGLINPTTNLKPEQGTHYELGYKLNKDNAAYRVALYHFDIKDAIMVKTKYDKAGAVTDVEYNNEDMKNTGIEASVKINHNKQFSTEWGFLYQLPEARDAQTYGDMDWHHIYNKWQFTSAINYNVDKFFGQLSLNYLGDRRAISSDERKLKPQLISNFDLLYKASEQNHIRFHVNNIFDRKDITSNSSSNFYSLGRNYTLTYEYRF